MLRCFEIIHEGNNNRARKKEAGSSNYARANVEVSDAQRGINQHAYLPASKRGYLIAYCHCPTPSQACLSFPQVARRERKEKKGGVMKELREENQKKSEVKRPGFTLLLGSSVSLLLKVVLDSALGRLAAVVLGLVLGLLGLVTRQAGDGAADSALDAVADAGGEIAGLALGLLLLALEVLLAARLLELLKVESKEGIS